MAVSTFFRSGRSNLVSSFGPTIFAAAAVVAFSATSATAQQVIVPGTANPWLAGMPDGSIAGDGFDTAPAQSPAQVPVVLADGMMLMFSVTGSVSNSDSASGLSPDGAGFISREPGTENGIANVIAPISSLIGVFLDSSQPSFSIAPVGLDFETFGLTFATLSPSLSQPFFIGDGLDGGGEFQQFEVPSGATRLYLGTMDGFQWTGNFGSFTVTVIPAPSAAALLGIGGLMATGRRRR